jgi:hypothetical protein
VTNWFKPHHGERERKTLILRQAQIASLGCYMWGPAFILVLNWDVKSLHVGNSHRFCNTLGVGFRGEEATNVTEQIWIFFAASVHCE